MSSAYSSGNKNTRDHAGERPATASRTGGASVSSPAKKLVRPPRPATAKCTKNAAQQPKLQAQAQAAAAANSKARPLTAKIDRHGGTTLYGWANLWGQEERARATSHCIDKVQLRKVIKVRNLSNPGP